MQARSEVNLEPPFMPSTCVTASCQVDAARWNSRLAMPTPGALYDDLSAAAMSEPSGADKFATMGVAALAPAKLRKHAGAQQAASVFSAMETTRSPPTQSSPNAWSFAAWLEEQGVAQAISMAFIGSKLAPNAAAEPDASKSKDELWAVRVSGCTPAHLRLARR